MVLIICMKMGHGLKFTAVDQPQLEYDIKSVLVKTDGMMMMMMIMVAEDLPWCSGCIVSVCVRL